MTPSGYTCNSRLCIKCNHYKPTVSGSSHNPAHGQRHFVCRECTQKAVAAEARVAG